MLKVFVYEFTCAADIRTYPSAGQLRREGRAMLAAVVADKLRLSGHFAEHNVRTPATELWSSKSPLHVERLPAVIKPRWGAGCLNAYLIRDPDQLRQLAVEAIQDEMLVQDFVAGQPA